MSKKGSVEKTEVSDAKKSIVNVTEISFGTNGQYEIEEVVGESLDEIGGAGNNCINVYACQPEVNVPCNPPPPPPPQVGEDGDPI